MTLMTEMPIKSPAVPPTDTVNTIIIEILFFKKKRFRVFTKKIR